MLNVIPLIIILIVVFLVIIGPLMLITRRRRRKFHETAKYRGFLEKLEEEFRQGKVSETAYLKLKAEYESKLKTLEKKRLGKRFIFFLIFLFVIIFVILLIVLFFSSATTQTIHVAPMPEKA